MKINFNFLDIRPELHTHFFLLFSSLFICPSLTISLSLSFSPSLSLSLNIYIYIYIYYIITVLVVTKSLRGFASNQVEYNTESAQNLG